MPPASRSPRAPARRLLAALAVTALSGSLLLPLAGPAGAKEAAVERSSDAYLCTGYAGCEAAGYSSAGYRENSGTMYWQMYSGHNCTNYVAYRMVKSGMPNVRPWSGSGNASNWGVALASKVDQTPNVGDVAWWRANVPGAGSAGHVAYVEKVVSANEIIVSEDSWGGDFHWHRYTRSGAWPSGFITLGGRPGVRNVKAPSITGRPRVGEPLRASKGAWEPHVKAAFQWAADGRTIDSATARRFTPLPRNVGERITVTVTARREGYSSGTAEATASRAVGRGRFEVLERPVVTGQPTVGETLSATTGTVSPSPSRRAFQWYASGEPIEGATDRQLTLTEAQQGERVRARVSVFGPGYKTRQPGSERTARVAAPPVEVTRPARVSGAPVLGERLVVDPGQFSPSRAEARYTWFRDGRRVEGAQQRSYDLRPADLGAQLAVRVDLVREGFRRASQTLEVAQPVRSTPRLTIDPVGGEHRAVVRLEIGARAVRSPDGDAVVRIGHETDTVAVEDGLARVVLRDLKAGERTVEVRYLGSDTVLPATLTAQVEVLRGRVGRTTDAGLAHRHTSAGRG